MSQPINLDYDYRRCPNCGSLDTVRRRGMHFDHMRRCPKCERSWDPDDEYQKWLAAEKERLEYNTHRD